MTEPVDKDESVCSREKGVRAWWASQSCPIKWTYVVMLLSVIGVLFVGLSASEPMVADEVVHYYMLVTQAEKLPAPNIVAEIPAPDQYYVRYYPHVLNARPAHNRDII